MRVICTFLLLFTLPAFAQDAGELAKKVKAKLDKVNDYQATGTMRTDVSFIKVPQSEVTVLYKKPNRFKIKKQDGITVTPKGGVSINLNSLIAGDNYTAVNAGKGTINGTAVTIIKLLPLDESSDVVVSTLYIQERDLLIYKATTTTKDNGTYEMEMTYGKWQNWGLPDKIVFIFNTQDYKLPKGLAFDYDAGSKPATSKDAKPTKGKVEISYSNYTINKGLSENSFL